MRRTLQIQNDGSMRWGEGNFLVRSRALFAQQCVTGGTTRGDPCEAASHHGFNGIEAEVVQKTVAWMLAK